MNYLKRTYKAEYGTISSENTPPNDIKNTYITFVGKTNDENKVFGLTETQLSKNIMCIGGTGSGKTNTINTMVNQIKKKMTQRDVMVIFDTKGDYEDKFYDKANDVIIGNSHQYKSISPKWNVFKEILADGWNEEQVIANIGEIGRSLFEKNKSQTQPFFSNAARGVFSAFLLASIRCAMNDVDVKNKYLNNKTIVKYFSQAGKIRYENLLNMYDDLKYIGMYLGDCENEQGLGVLAELLVVIKDTFIGLFGDSGKFSIREFIRNKGGRTLFIEYDLAIGETLSPVYSLLIDLALKEALCRNNCKDGGKENQEKVYIILDELRLLPNLIHLTDAVNFGRSMGVSIIAGIQSLTQIYDLYGEYRAKSIISGFSSIFVFKPNDVDTRDFARDYFGKNYLTEYYMQNQKSIPERRTANVVEDWDLNTLIPGEAIIGLDNFPPFRFYFEEYKRGL